MAKINPSSDSSNIWGKLENFVKNKGRFSSGKAKNDRTNPPTPRLINPVGCEDLAGRLRPNQFAKVKMNNQTYILFKKSEKESPQMILDTRTSREHVKGFSLASREQIEKQPEYATLQRISDRLMVAEVIKRFDIPSRSCIVLDQKSGDYKVIIYQNNKKEMVARRMPAKDVETYQKKHNLGNASPVERSRIVGDAAKQMEKRMKNEKADLLEEERYGSRLGEGLGTAFPNSRGGYTAIVKFDGNLIVGRFKTRNEAGKFLKDRNIPEMAPTPRNSISRETRSEPRKISEGEKKIGSRLQNNDGIIVPGKRKFIALSKREGKLEAKDFRTEQEARLFLGRQKINIVAYESIL